MLFIRRMEPSPPASYDIFMKRIEHIGFTSTGRPDARNDFETTLVEFKRRESRYMIPITDIQDRIDAKFYFIVPGCRLPALLYSTWNSRAV